MEEMKKKSTRGFASMDPEKQRAIARKGGESVPSDKRSFSKNPDLAAAAGRKGGTHVDPNKRSFARNPQLASEAGRKGGHASHRAGRRDAQPRHRSADRPARYGASRYRTEPASSSTLAAAAVCPCCWGSGACGAEAVSRRRAQSRTGLSR